MELQLGQKVLLMVSSSDLTAARNPAGGAWLSPSHGDVPSAHDAECELQLANPPC